MDDVLGVSLISMHQDMARMQRVAMNMSNALTPAYKREVSVARATLGAPGSTPFGSLWDAGMAASINGSGTVDPHAVVSRSDMRAGTLKSTGQPLDLALSGPGFFEVQTEHGPAYTRQGNFRMDERGRIVTAQGYPLMGKGGELFVSTANPTIDAAGNIVENKRPLGQLKVVQFEQSETLRRLGEGLFAEGIGMRQLNDAEVQVRQGYLENANVSSVHEMVEMMQTMRHFESMQKITQAYDDMLGNAIRRLSDG
ncbi:flagellar hook-basal body protein [Herbaspirillum sp. WGmk3]|uniref:flagellar hook-basal body protein n=1 Tax=Herbaspirillum sp. WGmk3 TaxID=2919925 RepID=UPI00209190EB|nr:flagellar hook-basal body protein [Herbaspirillum sp. WGmk3]MCO4855941.1 flagellar hook-basal body protein [Herbaspirillum sp. WGmk3]